MKIHLKKFGTTLISRPSGKEAFLAFHSSIKDLAINEKIEIDFEGVSVLTPSWADEFVTPLANKFKNTVLLNTENPSVKATLETLRKSRAAGQNEEIPS